MQQSAGERAGQGMVCSSCSKPDHRQTGTSRAPPPPHLLPSCSSPGCGHARWPTSERCLHHNVLRLESGPGAAHIQPGRRAARGRQRFGGSGGGA
jgi:hypothetical protein